MLAGTRDGVDPEVPPGLRSGYRHVRSAAGNLSSNRPEVR